MAQPGETSSKVLAAAWLVVGAALVLVPVWLGWTRWQVVLSGHPSMLALAIASGLLGIVAIAWAIATLLLGDRLPPAHQPRRTPQQLANRATWRIAIAVPALLICVVLAASLAWARPFAATPIAVAATHSSATVRIADRLGWLELVPIRRTPGGDPIRPTIGLVFAPGARVDTRAYAHILRPLAEAGYFVAILKEPLGVSMLQVNHAQAVLDVHPEINHWSVGGHSLGGVAASRFADSHPRVEGLLLFASYPSGALKRTELKVLSVSGTADRLTTPSDIEDAKADLPPGTQYVRIQGATHSSFGDYGEQRGDGEPGVPRHQAQAEIQKVTIAFMAGLAPKTK